MINKTGYKRYKLLLFSVIIIAIFFVINAENKIFAASASVDISTGTATQGENIVVTVTINADSNIGAYDFFLEYDPDILEAVSGYAGGGGGRIEVMYWSATASAGKTISIPITFKAKAPGTSAIKYVALNQNNGVIDFDTVENMTVSAKDGSVTVKAPVIASSNKNLSSMTVAAVRADGSTYNVNLTPGFSKDVTTYNLQVEKGVKDLVISAKTEDAKARVTIQWANLDPGDNTTNIIVTAEDGTTKKYTIYTKVPVPETTTPVPEEPIIVDIGGVEHYVEDVNDAVALPEGFETAEYDYNGETIIVGKGLSKDLIVMYLTKGDGSAGNLYIYNETKKTFYQMVNIDMTQKMYTIVEAPEDLLVPAGFTESTLNIGEASFQGWQNSDIEGIYLVYAMNWDGEEGLYFYDNKEKQMIKYFDMSVETGVALDTYNQLLAENQQLKDDIIKLNESNNNSDNHKNNLYKYIAWGCGALAIILFGVIIVLLVKRKNNEDTSDAMEEDTDYAEEGVVQQVSEELEDSKEVNDSEEMDETEEIADREEDESERIEEIEDDIAEEYDDDYMPIIKEKVEFASEYAVEGIIAEQMAESLASEVNEPVETVEGENAGEEENKASKETTEEISEEAKEEIEEKASVIDDEEALEKINEEAPEEMTVEEISEEVPEEENVDKKARVAEILDDENTSINEEDIDLVMDELFDDIFGE